MQDRFVIFTFGMFVVGMIKGGFVGRIDRFWTRALLVVIFLTFMNKTVIIFVLVEGFYF